MSGRVACEKNIRPHPGPLPRERENDSQHSKQSFTQRDSAVCSTGRPSRGGPRFRHRTTRAVRLLLPLPGGEGWGEGERQSIITPT